MQTKSFFDAFQLVISKISILRLPWFWMPLLIVCLDRANRMSMSLQIDSIFNLISSHKMIGLLLLIIILVAHLFIHKLKMWVTSFIEDPLIYIIIFFALYGLISFVTTNIDTLVVIKLIFGFICIDIVLNWVI